jgi:hypothetical protein
LIAVPAWLAVATVLVVWVTLTWLTWLSARTADKLRRLDKIVADHLALDPRYSTQKEP